jgi:hypothetical protein
MGFIYMSWKQLTQDYDIRREPVTASRRLERNYPLHRLCYIVMV